MTFILGLPKRRLKAGGSLKGLPHPMGRKADGTSQPHYTSRWPKITTLAAFHRRARSASAVGSSSCALACGMHSPRCY